MKMQLGNEYSDLIAYRLNGILGQDGRYYILKNRYGRKNIIVSDIMFKEILVKSKIPKVYAFVELSSSGKEDLIKQIASLSKANYNIRVYDKEGELLESYIHDNITEDEVGYVIRAAYSENFGEINYDLKNQKIVAEKIIKREEY